MNQNLGQISVSILHIIILQDWLLVYAVKLFYACVEAIKNFSSFEFFFQKLFFFLFKGTFQKLCASSVCLSEDGRPAIFLKRWPGRIFFISLFEIRRGKKEEESGILGVVTLYFDEEKVRKFYFFFEEEEERGKVEATLNSYRRRRKL